MCQNSNKCCASLNNNRNSIATMMDIDFIKGFFSEAVQYVEKYQNINTTDGVNLFVEKESSYTLVSSSEKGGGQQHAAALLPMVAIIVTGLKENQAYKS